VILKEHGVQQGDEFCIAGPYTSVNATLQLLENKFRVSAICQNAGDYPEKTSEADTRFTTVNVPLSSIATSNGQNDSGMFELNFKDERYMPFEGAGAISKWKLELPNELRQFDYDTISDVILQLRYTAVNGGERLKANASAALNTFINNVSELSQREGLFAIFDLKHDFPNEWHKITQSPRVPADVQMQLGNLADRLPAFARGRPVTEVLAKDVFAVVSTGGNFQLFQNAIPIAETSNSPFESARLYHFADLNLELTNWTMSLDPGFNPAKMWMVMRYAL
jgi:hypothetical protein